MSFSAARACTPIPLIADPKAQGIGGSQNAVMSKKLWGVGETIRYRFLDGTDNRKKAVRGTISTWMLFANIFFEETQATDATIRISFAGKGSWSAVGIDARNNKTPSKPTLNLGWLADQNPPSNDDRGTILHEFGHALGMMHEHQSPARGERIHLKELAVYNYYRPLLNNDDKLVKSQVIDVYNTDSVSNFSHLDLRSIMMYFMPASLNEEGVDIPVNNVLSDLDKAFITLTYPRLDKDVPKGGMTIMNALETVRVPDEISGQIVALLNVPEDAGSEQIQIALMSVRQKFAEYNMQVMALTAANQNTVRSADLTNASQFGIRDAVSKIIGNPLFTGIVKNVVKGVFDARGIPTVQSIPGAAQADIMDAMGTIVTNPTFANAISDMNTYFSGQAPEKPAAFASVQSA